VISYTITVANAGNTDLTDVAVSDPSVSDLAPVLSSGFNVGDSNQDNILSLNETWQYTASYTVTQGNIDVLTAILNTVTATSDQTTPVSATASVAVEGGASVDLTKTADVSSVSAAGDVIHYTINVLNDGNVTLDNPVVTDDHVNIVTPILDFNAPVLGPPILGPVLDGDYNVGDTNQNGFQDEGETFQFQIVGDDNNNGTQDSGETWLFTNIGDTNQNNAQDTGETFQYYNAGDTNHDGDQDSGETFQFNVDHSATAVLSGGVNAGDTNHNDQLDIGETWQYAVTYTVTQGDIDAGGTIVNTATVSTAQGASSSGSTSVTVATLTIDDKDHISQLSDPGGDGPSVGDPIQFFFEVTNHTSNTLTSFTVTDTNGNAVPGSLQTPIPSSVGPLGGFNDTFNHFLTSTDIANGFVDDDVTASGVDPSSMTQMATLHFHFLL